ncbi:MAG TPA: glutaminyl-peptide cyclotransferase [Chitinophagaceae bacterium]
MKKKIFAIIAILLIGVFALMTFWKSNKPADDNNPPTSPVANLSYSIVNVYPHDTSSFTQGLVIYKGQLYEGTGEFGHSHLMKVNLQKGEIEKKISLDPEYFGEGITILNDTIYQLTWKNKKVFVYTLPDFKKINEYNINTEGWGITNDGKSLIVSDGTNNLYFYSPDNFSLIKTQPVFEGNAPAFNLNELEFIDGFIYANQWQYPYILKIDLSQGTVIAKADFSDLIQKVKAKDQGIEALNGIAYDSASKKLYVTGKLWPELYEIRFNQ